MGIFFQSGTGCSELNREEVIYGVDTFPDRSENGSVMGLLKQPFHKYRKPTSIPLKETTYS